MSIRDSSTLYVTSSTVELNILATTDLHAQIFPYNYQSDKQDDSIGLSRTATLIAQIRKSQKNTILLDNGDFLQGNSLADYVALKNGLKNGEVHPVIAAMNALEYDAVTLGNHEFDYGVEFLMRAIKDTKFPVVSANILTQKGATIANDETLLMPFVILEKTVADTEGKPHKIRIGIIGFAPPQATLWDINTRNSPIDTRDILETARSFVPKMKHLGADIIVALTHSGIHPKYGDGLTDQASLSLSAIDGIDAIISGHTHQTFPGKGHAEHPNIDAQAGTLNQKPAVMSGALGAHLGVINITLKNGGAGWSVSEHHVENRPISHISNKGKTVALVASTPKIEKAAIEFHNRTLTYIRRPTGEIHDPISSYFSLLTPDRLMEIVTNAQLTYAKRILAKGKYADLPVLSAAAPFKSGGLGGPLNYIDISSGNLTFRHISEMYAFPDLLNIVKISGHDLREWLERSVGAFNHITPGRHDQMLRNPHFPCYYFDTMSGLTYEIDLSQKNRYTIDGRLDNPTNRRICNLCLDGVPVADNQIFAVATNSFRAGGGGVFKGANLKNTIVQTPKTIRDAIRDYIVTSPELMPGIRKSWSFKPAPDTSVLFDTGIGARNHIHSLTTIKIQDIGQTINGFARFRIDL